MTPPTWSVDLFFALPGDRRVVADSRSSPTRPPELSESHASISSSLLMIEESFRLQNLWFSVKRDPLQLTDCS